MSAIRSKDLDARARLAQSIEQAAARIPDPMVRTVFRWFGDQALEVNDLRRELHALRAELKENRVRYQGVWRAGGDYVAGYFVTHRGSLWHCNATDTVARPGDGSTDWTLAVKSK